MKEPKIRIFVTHTPNRASQKIELPVLNMCLQEQIFRKGKQHL